MDLNVCVNSITLLITELEGLGARFLTQSCAERGRNLKSVIVDIFLLGDTKAILRLADTLKEDAAGGFGSAQPSVPNR